VGFHCDNGSEYRNHTVVKLLNKLMVEEFTKSRVFNRFGGRLASFQAGE
jgi:hypothetical protein